MRATLLLDALDDETSPPGRYVGMTSSRAVYVVLLDPDRPPAVTRYSLIGRWLDGEALEGVSGLHLDPVRQVGRMAYRKTDPGEMDVPEELYVATTRSTSRVLAVLHVADGEDDAAIGLWLGDLREALTGDEDDVAFVATAVRLTR